MHIFQNAVENTAGQIADEQILPEENEHLEDWMEIVQPDQPLMLPHLQVVNDYDWVTASADMVNLIPNAQTFLLNAKTNAEGNANRVNFNQREPAHLNQAQRRVYQHVIEPAPKLFWPAATRE